jgi:hypothetical protein
MSEPQATTERKKWPTWLRVVLALAAIPTILLALFVCFVFGFRMLHDFDNVPLCDKQMWALVAAWSNVKQVDDLPNVKGRSAESLAALYKAVDGEEEGESETRNEKYQYIPGLRRGDPGDLVLMYMKRPTRWTHHAAGPPQIFTEAKWQLVPFDFLGVLGKADVEPVPREIPSRGECCERVRLAEFQTRLRKTLKFLRDNDRPHWQTVVAENEAFLKSLEAE